MVRKLICVIILSCLFLSACKSTAPSNPPTPSPSAHTPLGPLPTLSLPTPSPSQTPIRGENANYEIVTETYNLQHVSSEDKINIRYPQIRGLGDELKEKTINEMIKNHIFKKAVELEGEDYSDPYYKNSVLYEETVYHVMTQTDKLLSVFYEYDSRFFTGFDENRNTNSWRNFIDAYAITIDLVNLTRMQLSDFTRIDLPEEYPGYDLTERIWQSREIFGSGFSKVEYPGPEVYPDEDKFWKEQTAFVPGFVEGSENNYDRFFVRSDGLYCITKFGIAHGGYRFIKILDKAGPYKLPE